MIYKLSDIVSPVFSEMHRAIKSGQCTEAVAKGGRGSTKSSYFSIELILQMLRHENCHAAVFRKVGNTLRTSVYAQVCWAIGILGLTEYFKCTVSPMECVYIPTGQKVMFFGLDDPGKVKSIKVPFGYIGIGWFEELDQYQGEEEIRNVEQSLFRGGSFALSLKSFNPPAAQRNWANRYALEEKPGKMVHHSTYLDVPREWLGNRFIDDAEHLKAVNESAYRHEYLGEVTGSGRAIFENLRFEKISNDDIEGFDRIYHGVDWGWYPDPWAFNSCYYKNKRLYIFDELTRRRTSNEDTCKLLMDKKICLRESERLTADSAEKKSCADYTRLGLKCLPAIKGPGSVEMSMKWLQSLEAIIIDPARCPDTVKEFGEYEYEADKKTGEAIPGYPDINNHHIDACRYALESVWRSMIDRQ